MEDLRLGNNSLFEIATAETGLISITKKTRIEKYYGEDEETIYSISEIESYGEFYWAFGEKWNFDDCFHYIENPPFCRVVYYNRDYISWWLLQSPLYVDESIKSFTINRIRFYHSFDLIKRALEECLDKHQYENLLKWLELASINSNIYKTKTFNDNLNFNNYSLRIYFEGFDNNFIVTHLSLRVNGNSSFQDLLNNIYNQINMFVNLYSYEKEWILINQFSGEILNKISVFDERKIEALKFCSMQKIICKKIIN